LFDLPAVLIVKPEPIGRIELKGSILHLLQALLVFLKKVQNHRREIIQNPITERGLGFEVVGQVSDLFNGKVRSDSFCQDDGLFRFRPQLCQQRFSDFVVRQIGGDPFQVAGRSFVLESLVLKVDHARIIDFDPPQVRGKFQPVRPGVEARTEIDHGIHAFGDFFFEKAINDAGADDNRPGGVTSVMHVRGDLLPSGARKTFSPGILKKRVLAARFFGSVNGDPKRGIRNVSDFRHS